jgi:hypothetical protein
LIRNSSRSAFVGWTYPFDSRFRIDDFDMAVMVRTVVRALALVAASACACAHAATPIAWYKLDETTGTVAADSSGGGNNAAYVGAPTLGAPGVHRFGAYFSSGAQSVQAPASASLNALGAANADFSIAFWLKPNGTTGGWRPIIHKGSADAERGPGLWLNPANNRLHFRLTTTAGWNEGTDTVTDLPNGAWTHIASVKAGNKWRCYINGVLDTEFTLVGTSTGNSGPLYIGDDPWYSGAQAWFDDVRVYNVALSIAEVKALYGVVGWWKLDETAGTTAADSSSAGNVGAYVGAAALNVPGVLDRAVTFDGTDDYVTVPHSQSLVATSAVAVAAWVRPTAAGPFDRMILNKEGEYEVALVNNEIKWALANSSPGWAWHHTGVFVPHDRWSHVVVSYDGVQVKTYLNGQLAETYSASGTIGDVTVTHNELRIGARSSPSSTSFFAGRIDDVHVFTRSVTTAEVAALHGLLGHWKFDDAAGNAVSDSSILAGHAAIAAGAPAWTSGMRRGAMSFNGTTDHAATAQPFTPPAAGTVAFWFRSNGPPAARQRLFGLGTDFEMRQEPDGIVRCDLGVDGDTGGIHTVSALTTAGRWYHVAATFDSATETYAVYVDGQLVKSGVSAAPLNPQAAAILSFGLRTGTTERFAGALDDFRIYNRVLSQAEVYEVYGLVGWYRFNETSGTVAADSTGLGRDGAYVGLPALGAPSNGLAANGTAVDFNGANYMQVTGLFDRSASVSVTAWVKLDASDTSGADVVSLGDCFALRLRNATPGVQAAYYNGATWGYATANQSVVNAGWLHYAAVLDEAGVMKLYINGVEAASAAVGAIAYNGLGANTRVASHGNANTSYDLDGAIDELRIYNRIMQPEEVFRLYRGSRVNGVRILTWTEAR